MRLRPAAVRTDQYRMVVNYNGDRQLYDMENEKREMEERARRGIQVGTGGRSEKIRTYNWKDSRCSDHRIGQNYPLSQFLNGDIDPIINEMIAKDQEEKLREITEQTAAA